MNISLGNLSIQEFINRTGYDMSKEDRAWKNIL